MIPDSLKDYVKGDAANNAIICPSPPTIRNATINFTGGGMFYFVTRMW